MYLCLLFVVITSQEKISFQQQSEGDKVSANT